MVGADRLLTANALNSLNDNAGRIAGSALGGLLLAGGGLGAVVLLDAASFLTAALLIARIRATGAAAPGWSGDVGATGEATGARAAVWREWADGLRVIRRSPLLRGVFLVAAGGMVADGALTALLVPFVAGVAGLLGGALVGWLGPRFREADLVGWGLVAVGAGFLVIVNARSVPLILGVLVALGPAIAGWLTGQQTLLQRAAEDRYRGRVFGAFGAAGSLVYATAIGAASMLGEALGAPAVSTAGALLYAVAGVIALVVLRPLAGRAETGATPPA